MKKQNSSGRSNNNYPGATHVFTYAGLEKNQLQYTRSCSIINKSLLPHFLAFCRFEQSLFSHIGLCVWCVCLHILLVLFCFVLIIRDQNWKLHISYEPCSNVKLTACVFKVNVLLSLCVFVLGAFYVVVYFASLPYIIIFSH